MEIMSSTIYVKAFGTQRCVAALDPLLPFTTVRFCASETWANSFLRLVVALDPFRVVSRLRRDYPLLLPLERHLDLPLCPGPSSIARDIEPVREVIVVRNQVILVDADSQ
jgi:hypothetical protein